ncbi:MAG: hypothetical protein ACEQSU_05815 [Microgenomates group bacterium]
MQRDHTVSCGICLCVHEVAQQIFKQMHPIEKAERQFDAKLLQKAAFKEIITFGLKDMQGGFRIYDIVFSQEKRINRNGFGPDRGKGAAGAAANFHVPIKEAFAVKLI